MGKAHRCRGSSCSTTIIDKIIRQMAVQQVIIATQQITISRINTAVSPLPMIIFVAEQAI